MRKNTLDVFSCLKYQRSRGIPRERRGAVAFPVPCCRGLWDLAASSAEMRLEKSASEAQDRSNVSALSCLHACLRCQYLEPVPFHAVRVMCTYQLLLVSHLSVGTVCAAPAHPLFVKSLAIGEDTGCPVAGRRLQFPFHGITREHTKTCCGYSLV